MSSQPEQLHVPARSIPRLRETYQAFAVAQKAWVDAVGLAADFLGVDAGQIQNIELFDQRTLGLVTLFPSPTPIPTPAADTSDAIAEG